MQAEMRRQVAVALYVVAMAAVGDEATNAYAP
jgi:hypothetical protein